MQCQKMTKHDTNHLQAPSCLTLTPRIVANGIWHLELESPPFSWGFALHGTQQNQKSLPNVSHKGRNIDSQRNKSQPRDCGNLFQIIFPCLNLSMSLSSCGRRSCVLAGRWALATFCTSNTPTMIFPRSRKSFLSWKRLQRSATKPQMAVGQK